MSWQGLFGLPAAAAVLAAGTLSVLPAGDARPAAIAQAAAAHLVTIENLQFNPATLTVKSGQKVIWTNKDLVPHTVTAQDHAFDSGTIAPGASWSLVPKHKGKIQYVCSFPPTMAAALIVE